MQSAESTTPRSPPHPSCRPLLDLSHGGAQRRLTGCAGVEPGSGRTGDGVHPAGLILILPMVARLPCALAAARVASTARAQSITASRRSLSLVVPAWLASPGISIRHRLCAHSPLPTPTARPRSIRPRPCSTCSSTKAPTRARVSGSGPRVLGAPPSGAHRLGHGDAVRVTQRSRPISAPVRR